MKHTEKITIYLFTVARRLHICWVAALTKKQSAERVKAADCHESHHQSRDSAEAHLSHSRCHIQLYFVHPMWHFCTEAKKVLLLQDELLPRGTVLAWRCAAGDPERKERIHPHSVSRLLPLDLFLVPIMFVLYYYQVVTASAVRLHNSSIHSPWVCGNYWSLV